jgi:hypothetical protein
MRTIHLLSLTLVVLILASCGGSKKITKETASGEIRKEFIIPCADFSENSKDFFRATASAVSPNHQFAKDKATGLARNSLAQKIEVSVESLFDDYANQYDVGNEQDFKEVTKAITRQVTDQVLSGLTITCEQNFTLSSGVYEVWVGIEMPMENVGKSIYDNVSQEQKIRLDYDYEKFKEELQKELEKRRAQ